jgi:hypothetical protein
MCLIENTRLLRALFHFNLKTVACGAKIGLDSAPNIDE